MLVTRCGLAKGLEPSVEYPHAEPADRVGGWEKTEYAQGSPQAEREQLAKASALYCTPTESSGLGVGTSLCVHTPRLKTLAAVGQLPVTEPLLLLLWGTCLPLRPSSLQLALSPFVRPFLDGGALGIVKEV